MTSSYITVQWSVTCNWQYKERGKAWVDWKVIGPTKEVSAFSQSKFPNLLKIPSHTHPHRLQYQQGHYKEVLPAKSSDLDGLFFTGMIIFSQSVTYQGFKPNLLYFHPENEKLKSFEPDL